MIRRSVRLLALATHRRLHLGREGNLERLLSGICLKTDHMALVGCRVADVELLLAWVTAPVHRVLLPQTLRGA